MGQAWTYWVENGLVSGGDYNSNEVSVKKLVKKVHFWV